ncbi:hypothetical protein MTR67_052135 [Solanum verrucosum]|uniref:Uncharacterized protein n=1 Tax=Solanum verrucosum TaxID=315347 RepID=A0AAF0V577_SOLVR|nr:hypothetical protein MTR67_052135 [Solanum verrucosum]
MGGELILVNTVGTSTGQYLEDVKFEALYNEVVQYLGNQMRVLTKTTKDKVGTKVGTRIDIVVEKIGEMENEEIWKLKRIDMSLPMILHDQKNNLFRKEIEPRKCI